MKLFRAASVLLAVFVVGLFAVSTPPGLDQIFKNVEPGQRFHPFWPPVSGHQILGTVVVAKNPGKPQAFFETIDSPSYRNPAYAKPFVVGSLSLTAPDLTSEKQISAGVAFSQLDSIGKAISAATSSQSLKGTSESSEPSCQATSQTKTGTSGKTTGTTTSAKTTAQSGKSTDSSTTKSAGSNSSNVTGFDFCRFTNATSKVTGLQITYYDLSTLNDINANHALLPTAEQMVAKGSTGWIIHRALVVDSIEYTLTANTAIDAGFFAKLTTWMPTIKVGYKTQNTVTLKTTSPLTIGYKLWQRGLGVEGRDIITTADLPKLGIGDATIDALFSTAKK